MTIDAARIDCDVDKKVGNFFFLTKNFTSLFLMLFLFLGNCYILAQGV